MIERDVGNTEIKSAGSILVNFSQAVPLLHNR